LVPVDTDDAGPRLAAARLTLAATSEQGDEMRQRHRAADSLDMLGGNLSGAGLSHNHSMPIRLLGGTALYRRIDGGRDVKQRIVFQPPHRLREFVIAGFSHQEYGRSTTIHS
jgi:hypothetical protein